MATTYYLGAGASAGAIPCVADLAHRILEVSEFIQKFGISGKTIQLYMDNPIKVNHLSVDKARCKSVISTFCDRLSCELSIDTLAKLYYGQNRLEEYLTLKAILFASFLVWKKQKGIDKRYNNFWATLMLLKKNEFNDVILEGFGKNINIVSWNYDTQLEDSLISFYNDKRTDQSYYTNYDVSDTITNNTGIPYIKLNGSASFRQMCEFSDGGSKYSMDKISDSWLAHLVSSMILKPKEFERDIEGIRFCWEDDVFSREKITKFKTKLEKTEILVVIGYTFPSINHLVDTQLIGCMTNLRKVYFQGFDKSDSERIKDYFSAVLQNRREIILLPIDSKGFFVPPEATLESKEEIKMSSFINF